MALSIGLEMDPVTRNSKSSVIMKRCISISLRLLTLAVILLAVDRYYPVACCVLGCFNCNPKDAGEGMDIVEAARSQIGVTIRYVPDYEKIDYPNGDVPHERGVCSDVVIRALRKARAIDLQSLIFEDMKLQRWAYPVKSIVQGIDPNIVHRRVLNMECYFRRQGWSVKSNESSDLRPGDIVTCRVGDNLPHVMIVSDRHNEKGYPFVIHNIGQGVEEEDALLSYPIVGHFRVK